MSQSESPGKPKAEFQADLITSSRDFFTELVGEACQQRQMETHPQAANYLVELLLFYMNTENLYDEEDPSGRKTRETLAELYLKAGNAPQKVRISLLKKLGDTALYVSGFFGASLQRKIIDTDYYKDMGETAYGSLAECVSEKNSARVFKEFSLRFLDFTDLLTYISSKSMRPAGGLLQMFERYVMGSELAKDQIFEQGLIAAPVAGKIYRQ